MVYYYTYGGRTRVFAEALAGVLGWEAHELKSDLNERGRLSFLFKALGLAITKKPYPITNMPSVDAAEIYVCAPVWGGHMASPAKYFVENAGLKDKKVNVLLTCGNILSGEKFKRKAREALAAAGCAEGKIMVFATVESLPEAEVITGQLKEMLDESGEPKPDLTEPLIIDPLPAPEAEPAAQTEELLAQTDEKNISESAPAEEAAGRRDENSEPASFDEAPGQPDAQTASEQTAQPDEPA
ncbi:MAG: hypothetical protein FWF03_03440 [Defluviitaleaceae bacterium]|nr:hypothetical protein [Defluviitaleaceae bacterium]